MLLALRLLLTTVLAAAAAPLTEARPAARRPSENNAASPLRRSMLHQRLLLQYNEHGQRAKQTRNATSVANVSSMGDPAVLPKMGQAPPSPFDFGAAKFKYRSVQEYCDGELTKLSQGQLRRVYEDSYPLTGNTPRGCVIGCLMGNGIVERWLRRRGLMWNGKCFDPGYRVWNYMIPRLPGEGDSSGGGNINNGNVTRFLLRMIPGLYTQGGISWADNRPTIFIDYPPNLYWQAVTMLATAPLSVRYPNFHDEIREVPQSPGLFVGVSWAKPFTLTNLSPLRIVALRFALFQTRSGLEEFDDQINGMNFFQRMLRSLRRGIDIAAGTPSIELKAGAPPDWWDGLDDSGF